MGKIEGNQPGVKAPAAGPAAPGTAAAPAGPKPTTDALQVTPGSAPATAAEKQAAVLAAAKAALGAAAGTAAPANVGSLEPKSWWQKALQWPVRTVGKFASIVGGDHPAAAIARGALRMVPVAGVLSLAHDTQDAAKSLFDPKVPLGQKLLVGAKFAGGAAAVGASGLLLVTGAGAFLPYAMGAGAVALVADVALSRIRRGSW